MGYLRQICYTIVTVFTFHTAYSQNEADDFFSSANRFFNQYVSNGLVNYSAIHSDRKELDSLTIQIRNIHFELLPENVKKTFLINTYNILVIKNVVDHYPIKSPMDISGFYNGIKYEVGGKKITLDEIENKELRPVYKDARLHFVLVCGANGCPPIISNAFLPDKLENQMDVQAKAALNNNNFITVNDAEKKVLLSEIFKWYEEDFKQDGSSVIGFINKYRENKIPEDYKVDYYDYDWSLNEFNKNNTEQLSDPTQKTANIQAYTPSVLLKRNQWEYKFFNNLYTQTEGFDKDGNKINYHSRSSYFSSINQFLIGISPRLSIGADMWIKSVRNDSETSSPFALLKFENTPNTRTAISSVGPKIKIAPFKKLAHLSVQSTFLIPVSKDQEGASNGKPYLSADRYFLITQFYYDHSIGNKFQLFFQLAPWLSVNKTFETKSINLATPLDVFLSWFPSKRVTVYVQNEFWPSYNEKGISSWFRQEGVGLKFQLIPGLLETEVLYTKFTMGMNAGAGQTFNFGVRVIR
ncbi:MAG: DUF547 domain-containing protein [Bacteroidetes bacterium]|nr:DUF547 domain-containing protein [Bacteroidota bacterium]HET6243156.1 DUF547 domain-containing protein [Bacteroidia bacterium]